MDMGNRAGTPDPPVGQTSLPVDVEIFDLRGRLVNKPSDAFGATLLGKSLNDLPFIGMAEAAGLGTADYRSLNPVMAEI